MEAAGGKGEARIGVITAASSNAVENGDFYTKQFEKYGAAEAYWIPLHSGHPEGASDPLVILRVRLRSCAGQQLTRDLYP